MADIPSAHHPSAPHHENRLAKEKSPYLLQHKNNPVDWYPWGEEAIEKARKENKPIFLSVGYSTCHWCHVMERESFESEETAEVMNEKFVNIKVDREERPDIDKIYMAFVQATTGGGGWPMSVFIAPDNLKPFYGGTYFPSKRQYGRPSFVELLNRIDSLWHTKRSDLIEQADQVIAAIRDNEEQESKANAGEDKMSMEELQDVLLVNAFRQISKGYDAKLGGFSRAPKFPRPVVITAALAYWWQTKNNSALEMVLHTLHGMAEGGMYDHLGGGFHRYSVTPDWQVPHFEKMLYDQAQLVISYLEAYQITKDPFYARIAEETLQYVVRDMAAPEGGFYSAEDADSLPSHDSKEKSEGAFYIWAEEEIDRLLDATDAKIFKEYYGVSSEGNVDPDRDPHDEFTGRNIVWKVTSAGEVGQHHGLDVSAVEESLKRSRKTLFDFRKHRPRPHLDDKILTSWNALMISAFAKASQILQKPEYLDVALKAKDFILRELYSDGVLIRNYRHGRSTIRAFADDYAFFVTALLDLWEATFDPSTLETAIAVQAKMDELFWDQARGGYYSFESNDPYHVMRMKEDYDGAEPSPNSYAAMNLVRLANMLHSDKYKSQALKLLEAFRVRICEAPIVLPHMVVAAALWGLPPKQVVVAGQMQDSRTRDLLSLVRSVYDPHQVLLLADGGAAHQFLKKHGLEFLQSDDMSINGVPAVYICENFTCKLPITDKQVLLKALIGEVKGQMI
eukprot:TRINITY_DN7156_c0_g1_i1.p1 TRINITY_DN7156_c0_g1~~TRINITY_DN7156_c0_g1_i1.p1  ORF type:complete len:833 (+),score=126.47 TRINITY_DN7156_c0_g1_i1:295-2499(+)